MASVGLRAVRKRFGQHEVIRGIDLEVEDRALAVFVGPSGSGKSTLLRLIAGLEGVSSGDILIDGERVNHVPPARRGLAMVFQSYALYPHMTVGDNMGFSLRLAGVPAAERDRKVRDAARILRLEPLLSRKPRELSGGERQRVAIGRAIVRSPKVFLFDEPLSNLDAGLRVDMRVELLRLHDTLNATMIYVTHDQVEAMTLADSLVVLRDGAVEQSGAPLDVYWRPRNLFVACFIGSPPMNLLAARVKAAGEAGVTVSVPGAGLLTVAVEPDRLRPDDPVTLGVRPTHVRLAAQGQFRGVVVVVERLGGETHLHLQLEGGQTLIVKTGGESPVRSHDHVALQIDAGECHLFDTAGEALRPIDGR